MAKGATLGYLRYILGLDTVSFKRGMTEAERDLVVTQKKFEAVGSKMANIGSTLSVAITAPLAALASKGIAEAQSTQAAMAQVNAALASMGPVAGRTAQQLEQAANAFEGASLFEADAILKDVTANLLTFGNISGKAFDQAQQAAINLSARLGTDLKSSAILVGKALNDPVKGMAALGRAGVQFSADQQAAIKAMVDTGNVAGAQAVILAEFQKQFGGAAQAAQNADPLNKASDAFKQMAEAVGNALLPILPALTDAIVTVTGAFTSLSPETQKFVLVAAATAAAVGPLLSVFGNIVLVVSSLGPAVSALATAWGALQAAFLVARTAALATLPALVPFLAPLAAIAGAVTLVYLAWKNWDRISAIAKAVYTGVKTWLMDRLSAVFNWVRDRLKAVGDWFFTLYDRVVGNSYVPDMVDGIASEMARLQSVMVEPARKATESAAEAFRLLQQNAASLLAQLFPEAARQNQLVSDINLLKEAADKGAISADTLAAALARLREQYLAAGGSVSSLPIDLATAAPVDTNVDPDAVQRLIDQLPRVKGLAGEAGAAMGELTQQAFDWGEAMQGVALDIAAALGRGLAEGVKFKDLLKQIAAIGINFLTGPSGPLASLLGGARADGGPVSSGKVYLVGERGPELFAPGASGRIIPNHKLAVAGGRGMGGGTTQIFNIRTPDADSFRRSQGQLARDARRRLDVGRR